MKKIILTGGHAGTTALAVIQQLLETHDPKELLWIGPKYAFEGSNKLTLEFKVFPQKNVDCIPIVAGRLQRKFTRYTFSSLVKIPIGFIQAFFILLRARPHVVLSFGGFAAFPVIVAAFFFGIPIILHEQTTGFGLANRMSTFFATKIAIARLESRKHIESDKLVHVGNPLMKEILSVPVKKSPHKPPVLYITGGSRGSQIINKSVDEILEKLTRDFIVIHQTGEFDFEHFKKRKELLAKASQKRYEVFDFASPLTIHTIFNRADILVGRSGANTVSEVMAIGLPSIFIPIPWSQKDEQTQNARLAVTTGNAVLLRQNDLNGEELYSQIINVYKKYSSFTFKGKNNNIIDRNAARELALLLENYSE